MTFRVRPSQNFPSGKPAPLDCYRVGQEVRLLITRRTPLGYGALVEELHEGLLFHDKLSGPLEVGDVMKGYVKMIRPDGKLDLSLDPAGYQRVTSVCLQILQVLQRRGGVLLFDDKSSPEEIREVFGVSKKAFKQALGKLYKLRRIEFTKPGIKLLDNSDWSPTQP